MKRIPFLLALVLLLAGLGFNPLKAQAAGSCEVFDYADIVDDASLCQHANAFNAQDIEVTIFTTDENPSTQNGWYDVLDAFEADNVWFSDGSFPKGALVIEFNSQNTWQTVAVGDRLFYDTPVGATGDLSRFNDRLESEIATNGPTQGVKNLLDFMFKTAYPPIPTPQPQAPIVQNTEVYETNVDFGPLVRGVFFIVVVAALSVGGYYLYIVVVAPALKASNRKKELLAQRASLRKQVQAILLASHGEGDLGLLQGSEPTATLLYVLWSSAGGKGYPDKDVALIQDLGRAMSAYEAGNLIFQNLIARPEPESLTGLEQQVKAWEELYVSLTGNSEEILSMTPAEQAQLMNPTTVVARESIDDALLAQMDRTLRQLEGAGSLRIKFLMIDPSQFEGRGILGNVEAVKDKLAQLEQARQEAPKALAQAEQLRAQLAESLDVPEGTTIEKLLAPVDILIAEAKQAQEAKLWFTMSEKAQEAISEMDYFDDIAEVLAEGWTLLEGLEAGTDSRIAGLEDLKKPIFVTYRNAVVAFEKGEYVIAQGLAEDVVKAVEALEDTLGDFTQALKVHDKNLGELSAIAGKGFNLDSTKDEVSEAEDDIVKVNQFLVAGNYGEASRYVSEITADSNRAISEANKLVEMQAENGRQLQKLSTEVGRVQALADEVLPKWQTLQTYPRSNWEDEAGLYDKAVAILRKLFDNPADDRDLASQISRLNNLDGTQDFIEADRLLDAAFVELSDAERMLNAVASQLKEVKALEATLADQFQSVDRDIERATARRNMDNEKINDLVDGWISTADDKLESARREFSQRNFTTSAALLSEANTLANKAYAEAEEQAKKIDALLVTLENMRSRAEAAYNSTARIEAGQAPVVRNASTSGMVSSALTALKQAKSDESSLSGLEDISLQKGLEGVISLYEKALNLAQNAESQLEEDQSEYDGYVSRARNAHADATRAISAATNYTSHSDAGYAGDSALDRARRALGSQPSSGETKSQLDAKRRAAEEAEKNAEEASRLAQSAIAEAEEARERERRRREAEESRIREEQEARERAARKAREEAEEARRRSSYSSTSYSRSDFGSSHRSSSSSSSHRSSSGGSSHRSSSGGGRHR